MAPATEMEPGQTFQTKGLELHQIIPSITQTTQEVKNINYEQIMIGPLYITLSTTMNLQTLNVYLIRICNYCNYS